MNPLYDISTTGFVSATKVMEEREHKNRDLMASSAAAASSGTPRAARQARGVASTSPVTTAAMSGGAMMNGAESPSILADEMNGVGSDRFDTQLRTANAIS